MLENPYQAPSTLDGDGQPSLKRRPKIIGIFEVCEFLVMAFVLSSAVGHQLQINNLDAYRTSPLIFFEIVGVLGALALVPVALARAVYLLLVRRFAAAALNILIAPSALAAVGASMWIDAPTLIYAT